MSGKVSASRGDFVNKIISSLRVRPDKVAVRCGNSFISCQSLDRKSHLISCYIKKNFPEVSRIGVSLNPSIDLIVVLLAIVKSGATYIPIDTSYPEKYIQLIVSDSEIRLLFVENDENIKKLKGIDLSVITPKKLEQIVCNEDQGMSFLFSRCDTPIHLLYTSGTSGVPKGVINSPLATLNRLEYFLNKFPFQKNEVFALSSSFTHIPSVYQIFGTLLAGEELLIIPHDIRRNLSLLLNYLVDNRVTRYMTIPSLLNDILEEFVKYELKSNIGLWFVSGEKLSVNLVKKFYSIFPNSKLVSIYGSTEAEDVLYYETSQDDIGREFIPLGDPIAKVSTCIMDKNSNLLETEGEGELYVSGSGLSLGYTVNTDAAKNNKKSFLRHFSPNGSENSLTFKTGDLVRRHLNGDLEYIGRADFQLKISGCRIEPQEIENLVVGFKRIDHAIVISSRNKVQELDFLVGYYSCNKEIKETVIIRYLAKYLPDFKIPKIWVQIKEWPRTLSNKIDLKNLPLPHLKRQNTGKPQCLLMEKLIRLWSGVLGIERRFINVDKEFFNLGGTSLLAMRLCNDVVHELGVSLSLENFYKYPSIRGLSQYIASQMVKTNKERIMSL